MSDITNLDPELSEEEILLESEIPDAASASGLRKSLRKKKSRDDQSREFWASVFSSPIGRQEMWKLLTEAHTFDTRFACGPSGFPQPEATWFHAGEQNFGLSLYHKLLALSPPGVLQMHIECDSRFIPTKPRRLKLTGD